MITLAAHRHPAAPPTVQPQSSELTAVTDQFASFALDCLETAVFVLDADLRIHFASAAAKRLLDEGRLFARYGLLGSPIGGKRRRFGASSSSASRLSSIGPAPMTFHRLGDVEDALCLASSRPAGRARRGRTSRS